MLSSFPRLPATYFFLKKLFLRFFFFLAIAIIRNFLAKSRRRRRREILFSSNDGFLVLTWTQLFVFACFSTWVRKLFGLAFLSAYSNSLGFLSKMHVCVLEGIMLDLGQGHFYFFILFLTAKHVSCLFSFWYSSLSL